MRTRLRIVLTVSLLGVLALGSSIVGATSYQSLASRWTKTYGGTSNDIVYSITETGDGGYALAGRTDSLGIGSSTFWMVKTDEVGNMQRKRTYEGTEGGNQVTLIQTED